MSTLETRLGGARMTPAQARSKPRSSSLEGKKTDDEWYAEMTRLLDEAREHINRSIALRGKTREILREARATGRY